MQKAIFGAGCFWCTQAVFQSLKGVSSVLSGYMGGELKHPTYMEISNGDTGHIEVVNIEFDEKIISFNDLLLVFFKTHNPTSLNKQGNDVGTQYRSVIFYDNELQKLEAEKMISLLKTENTFKKPIITDIRPAVNFYIAEDYHQDYYHKNQSKPYCTFVIQPKLNQLATEFQDKIKPNEY